MLTISGEIQREKQATGADVWVGLYTSRVGRTLLVMANTAGNALGPAVCHHYEGQTDFLWLEEEKKGRVWCLVRAGTPVAEGTGSLDTDIAQALSRQQGSLTIISPDPQVQSWLQQAAPDNLKLHWLWLERSAWSSLTPCLPLRSASSLLRRNAIHRTARMSAMALALLMPAFFLYSWYAGKSGPGASPALAQMPAPEQMLAALPAQSAMREFYQLALQLWSRGAGNWTLIYDGSSGKPKLELTVFSAHSRASSALSAWAKKRNFQLSTPLSEDSLLLVGVPKTPPVLHPLTAGEQISAPTWEMVSWQSNPAWLLHRAGGWPQNALLTALSLEGSDLWRLKKAQGQMLPASQLQRQHESIGE